MKRIITALLAAWLLPASAFLLPTSAWSQGLDMSKGGAIDITARDGMEWRQNDMMVIANGDARAVRGDVTVTADRLIARYRKKAGAAASAAPGGVVPASAPASPAGKPPGSPPAGAGDTGANEIYRLEAEGNVKIFTATDLAVGDKAIYDMDQAVLLLTGSAMSITTPQQVMTARDTIEYWSQKRMGVGRGLAVVTTSDGRRVTGDVLVGFTEPPAAAGATPATATAPKPEAAPAKQGADPLLSSGKLQRVEGFGNVEVRTATEIIKGDRGVYVAETGIARLAGHVRITRGQNQLEGDEALVNMRTGISTLVRDPGQRVQGLVMPNDASTPNEGGKSAPAKTTKGSAPSTPARTR
jgi:lipopolysaccharide export system protein LptA